MEWGSYKLSQRRNRNPYLPLRRPSQIQQLLEDLRQEINDLPEDIPSLYKVLCAVRNYRPSVVQFGRGRPREYPVEKLRRIRQILETLLHQRTVGTISVRSFIDNQLRLLRCPADIQGAVEAGTLTIQEGLILNRINDPTLRYKLLDIHTKERGSATTLLRRVKEILGGGYKKQKATTEGMNADRLPQARQLTKGEDASTDHYKEVVEELENFSFDATDLFGEQARFIIECLRALDVDKLDRSEIDAILKASEDFGQLLYQLIKQQQM
jgi:hypothetical protein